MCECVCVCVCVYNAVKNKYTKFKIPEFKFPSIKLYCILQFYFQHTILHSS